MKINTMRIFLILAVLILLAVGFALSNQTSTESLKLTDGILIKLKVLSVDDVVTKTYRYRSYSSMLRGVMHFVLYTVGTVPIFLLIFEYSRKLLIAIPLSLVVVISYATFDEFHQEMISGRGYEYFDFILDICGALMAVVLVSSCILVVRGIYCKEKDV